MHHVFIVIFFCGSKLKILNHGLVLRLIKFLNHVFSRRAAEEIVLGYVLYYGWIYTSLNHFLYLGLFDLLRMNLKGWLLHLILLLLLFFFREKFILQFLKHLLRRLLLLRYYFFSLYWLQNIYRRLGYYFLLLFFESFDLFCRRHDFDGLVVDLVQAILFFIIFLVVILILVCDCQGFLHAWK